MSLSETNGPFPPAGAEVATCSGSGSSGGTSSDPAAGGGAESRRARPHPEAGGSGGGRGTGGGTSGNNVLRLLTATYGPSDGRRLLNGEMSCTEAARAPHTRDVLPFLRALMTARGCGMVGGGNWSEGGEGVRATGEGDTSATSGDEGEPASAWACQQQQPPRIARRRRERRKVAIPVMDGKSMNSVFGDPCPGTTKCLKVTYLFCDDEPDDRNVCRASFQEHERVVLRRVRTHYQDDGRLKRAVVASRKKGQRCGSTGREGPGSVASATEEKKGGESDGIDAEDAAMAIADRESRALAGASGDAGGDSAEDESELRALRRMGRSQSLAEMAALGPSPRTSPRTSPMNSPTAKSSASLTDVPVMPMITEGVASPDGGSALAPTNSAAVQPQQHGSTGLPPAAPRKWRLRSATSEIVLPMALPYLEVRQRALCQRVCKTWRFVIKDLGVAQKVDVSDPSFPNFTRSLLRGIMAQSHSSLQSLILNDFADLTLDDLRPAIPHLRKLRTLDISRCTRLDDATLLLLSEHLGETLEVFYMKGLIKATDAGVTAVCRSCRKLRVLEISNVPITDASGLAVGENLDMLEALYMRDNYKLTNESVDVITEKCTKLTELTLWGCTKLRHFRLGCGSGGLSPSASPVPGGSCSKIVLLNLWGCHSLVDEAAASMGLMHDLRSLIVSECHKLTDAFVVNLSQAAPQIQHLHLRYVRRITDVSLSAIANNMHRLYYLDLSFCTRITPSGVVYLLENAYRSLSELILYSCFQLDMTIPQQQENGRVQRAITDGAVGRLLLGAIRSHVEGSCLSIFDVRECKGRHRGNDPRKNDEIFIGGMQQLKFVQKVPGFFARPARWNADVERRLVEQYLREDETSGYSTINDCME